MILFTRQKPDAFRFFGPLCEEFFGGGVAVVGEVEAGGYGAAEEGDFAIADEAGALPDSGGDDELDALIGHQI